jgi:hypothetical protein
VAVVLAVAGAIWLLVWPCPYAVTIQTSTGAGVAGESRTICHSFFEENDAAAALVFAIPVGLAVAGLVGARTGRTKMFIGSAVLLFGFCFLASLSIGLWFLPAAIAMLIAVTIERRPPRARSLRRRA